MTITLNGTTGIVNDATDLNYTGTLTGGTGVVNIGSGQVYKGASGNVGIGTSSPAYKIDLYNVNGATPGARIYGNDQSNVRLRLANVGTGGINWDIVSGLNGVSNSFFSIYDATAAATRLAIDNSGNLLVGTTSAVGSSVGSGFQVQSNGGTGSTINIGHPSSAGSGFSYALFAYNNAFIGSIGQSGTTAVAYNTTSDYRLKENITPLTSALARIVALKPCTYTWKSAPDEVGEGFIAHELAEVCPQAVTGEKDAVDADGNPQYQGIDTSFLVATLTAAIQELKTLVDTQAARITALEAPIV